MKRRWETSGKFGRNLWGIWVWTVKPTAGSHIEAKCLEGNLLQVRRSSCEVPRINMDWPGNPKIIPTHCSVRLWAVMNIYKISVYIYIYQITNISIYQNTNISIYQYTNIPIYQYINISIYQNMNIPIYQCLNIYIYIYQWFNLSIYQFIKISIYKYMNESKYQSINISIYQYQYIKISIPYINIIYV